MERSPTRCDQVRAERAVPDRRNRLDVRIAAGSGAHCAIRDVAENINRKVGATEQQSEVEEDRENEGERPRPAVAELSPAAQREQACIEDEQGNRDAVVGGALHHQPGPAGGVTPRGLPSEGKNQAVAEERTLREIDHQVQCAAAQSDQEDGRDRALGPIIPAHPRVSRSIGDFRYDS